MTIFGSHRTHVYCDNSNCRNYGPPPQPKNVPNPTEFKILDEYHYGEYVVVMVEYKGCTNFDGKKILVIHGRQMYLSNLKAKKLDPHFLESNNIIARFRPTKHGFDMAKKLAKMLEQLTE